MTAYPTDVPQLSIGATTFRGWQRDVNRLGLPRLVGFAGSRGKSTVLRLTEAALMSAHLTRCTWTDMGVHIQGRLQRGELGGWERAVMRLAEGSLDVGLQEIDWSTVNAVGLPKESYPGFVITGLRENGESALASMSFAASIRAARTCIEAVHPSGFVVINGDDWYAMDLVHFASCPAIVVSRSSASPALQSHLEQGGTGAWAENGRIFVGDGSALMHVCDVHEIPLTLAGDAAFNVTNVLLAVGACVAIGLDRTTIRHALCDFRASWDILPASMNIYDGPDYRVAIDQVGPEWVMRNVLKALDPKGQRRHLSVVGNLDWIDDEEITDLGRLLGRYQGAIITYGEPDDGRLELLRAGIVLNDFPPLLISMKSEHEAIERAFHGARSGDLLLILTNRSSGLAHQIVKRHIR